MASRTWSEGLTEAFIIDALLQAPDEFLWQVLHRILQLPEDEIQQEWNHYRLLYRDKIVVLFQQMVQDLRWQYPFTDLSKRDARKVRVPDLAIVRLRKADGPISLENVEWLVPIEIERSDMLGSYVHVQAVEYVSLCRRWYYQFRGATTSHLTLIRCCVVVPLVKDERRVVMDLLGPIRPVLLNCPPDSRIAVHGWHRERVSIACGIAFEKNEVLQLFQEIFRPDRTRRYPRALLEQVKALLLDDATSWSAKLFMLGHLEVLEDRLIRKVIEELTSQGVLVPEPVRKAAYQSLKKKHVIYLTPEQVKELLPDQVQELTPEQVQALAPEQVKELLPEQVRALRPEQVQALKPEQVQALKPNQLKQALQILKENDPDQFEEIKTALKELLFDSD